MEGLMQRGKEKDLCMKCDPGTKGEDASYQ